MKIGLFDSGLGGLTILKAVTETMPEYDYIFYGDTANLPLGDKTEEEIFLYTKSGVEELFRQGAVLVIIACNTASAETLRRIQDGFLLEHYPDRRVLGVIIPTVEELTDSGSRASLLIATKRTVESGKYALELTHRGKQPLALFATATPSLVPAIEAGESDIALNEAIATIEKEREQHDFDTVVLGCTHYTKLKDGLRAHFKELRFLSQDEIIPKKLNEYLKNHPEIESRLSRGGTRSIHLTLERADYQETIKELLDGDTL